MSSAIAMLYAFKLLSVMALFSKGFKRVQVQWKLDLADTDLAENFDLKDTLQKI